MSGGTGYGVTPQGFVMPQLTDLQEDLVQGFQSQFGAGVRANDPQAVFGQLSGVMAERLSLVWQSMQDVYQSQIPSSAYSASLDNLGELRGIPRLKATSSIVLAVKLFGTIGTVVPITTQFSVAGAPTNLFSPNSQITLGAGTSCIQTVSFSGTAASGTWTLAINGGITAALSTTITAAQLQVAIRLLPFCSGCTVTGSMSAGFTITFAGAGTGGLMIQPSFTASSSLLTGGSAPIVVTPAITTAGVDQGSVTMTATSTGPVAANAGSLTVIATPLSGLTNVLNVNDATLGTNVESDNAYKIRMNEELQSAGAGTVEAIRSNLLKVAGVTSVFVYENTSSVTNAQGLPPKSFEAYVTGGADADIGNKLWEIKDAGIATYGTSSYTITDSQGVQHVMYWSRPTQIPIYIIANLTTNVLTYPSNGDALVKAALVSYINGLAQGTSVNVVPLLVSQLASIPGIDGATLLVGTSPGPTSSNNIPISAFQQATTQTTYITVNDTPG